MFQQQEGPSIIIIKLQIQNAWHLIISFPIQSMCKRRQSIHPKICDRPVCIKAEYSQDLYSIYDYSQERTNCNQDFTKSCGLQTFNFLENTLNNKLNKFNKDKNYCPKPAYRKGTCKQFGFQQDQQNFDLLLDTFHQIAQQNTIIQSNSSIQEQTMQEQEQDDLNYFQVTLDNIRQPNFLFFLDQIDSLRYSQNQFTQNQLNDGFLQQSIKISLSSNEQQKQIEQFSNQSRIQIISNCECDEEKCFNKGLRPFSTFQSKLEFDTLLNRSGRKKMTHNNERRMTQTEKAGYEKDQQQDEILNEKIRKLMISELGEESTIRMGRQSQQSEEDDGCGNWEDDCGK